MKRILLLAVAALGCTAAMVARAEMPATAPATYHVLRTMHIGGVGRWDYGIFDAANHRIFVTRQSHVQVIDPDTGEVLGDIPNCDGCHGVALDADAGRGFVSCGTANAVTIFDLKTLATIGQVPAGTKPDCIIYDKATKQVMAFNGKSHDVTFIDPNIKPGDAPTVPALSLPGKPEFAAADGTGRVFVNIEDKSEIAVIDANAHKVTDVWKIDGAQSPSGLAIDVADHRLFSGCDSAMAIIDIDSSKTVATVPIGDGVDACGYDPGTGEAFASCGDGTLSVVTPSTDGKFNAVSIPTRKGARTMALDATTGTLYLPTAEFVGDGSDQRHPQIKPDSFELVVVGK
jgi:hypothetical protein